MTDEQIIKALEYCCGSIQNDCMDCPFGERCENDESLLKYSLDLINRQKEEKEHLEYVLSAGCNDRNPGCHSQCTKYIEWKKNYMEYKTAIKDHIRKVARCEEYEITQRLKNSRKKCREI